MLRTRIIIFSSIILLLTAIGSSQDPSLSYQKFIRIEGNNWRVHFEGSSVLTLYGHGTRKASSASAAAAQFLTDFHSMLRIKQLSDIHFVKTEVTPLGNHFYYQQYFAGMAVVGGEISLHFDQQHRLIAATNGYHPLTGSVHFTDDRESAFNTAREM
ncbi:MAG TPA: hypothetical protein VLH08_07330, partial [Acidobacteriota bacterium]|nr:hypothetical protein [Acidobacteriota bacterium]